MPDTAHPGTPDGGLPDVVRTPRLRLIPVSPADAADMLAGRRQDRWHPDYPRADDVDAAALSTSDAGPAVGGWGARHVVHGLHAVGTIGFFGPPVDGEVEVGFGLVAAMRGQGLATEALAALLAETDRLGLRVRASVEPSNSASLRVLAKAGFTGLRGSDDDGRLIMVRPVPGTRVAPASPRPRAAAGRPTGRVRLVATDLDGTLLRSDGSVSPRTRQVLAAVEDAGIPVVFVTARPLRWMEELWALVGDHGLAVVSNGAVLFDVAAREVRAVRGLERAAGLEVVAAVRSAVPDAQFAIETLDGIRLEPSYDEPHHVPPGSPVGPMHELWDTAALKLLVRHPAMGRNPSGIEEQFRAAVVTAVGGAGVATWSVPGLVEISAPGVTKAAALADLCAARGVAAADVLAFGDMPNDLAMLEWAGTSYAVANAHPSVRAAADRIAADHDDDGVARVLAELVPGALDLF